MELLRIIGGGKTEVDAQQKDSYEFSFTDPNQPFVPWVGLNIQNIQWDWEWFDNSYYQLFSKIEIPTSQTAFEKIEKKLIPPNK